MSVLSVLSALTRMSAAVVWHVLTMVWRLITANPWRALALALALVCGWTFHVLAGARTDRDAARTRLAVETKGRGDDRAAFELAGKQAEQRWIDAFAQQRLQFQQATEKADHDDQAMRASFAARSDDYARRMRFAAICPAVAGVPGQPASTAQGGAPQGADGPGADAVVVGRADFDILTDNTRRLKVAHDWAVEIAR